MKRPAPFLALALLVPAACSRTPSEGKADFEAHPSVEQAAAPLGHAAAAAPVEAPAGSGKGVAFVSGGYKQAMVRARAEKKLVMVNLYADWCGWCHKLDQDVFADARVAAALGEVIPIKLDADRDGQDVAETFRVEGLPTTLFLDGSGKLVKRVDGYVAADQMIAIAGSLPKGPA